MKLRNSPLPTRDLRKWKLENLDRKNRRLVKPPKPLNPSSSLMEACPERTEERIKERVITHYRAKPEAISGFNFVVSSFVSVISWLQVLRVVRSYACFSLALPSFGESFSFRSSPIPPMLARMPEAS